MPKLLINATELQSPDVDVVAMVKRGANRIPFRITKEDKTDMIDLAKIGRGVFAKKEPAAPTVIAAILSKQADVAAVTSALVSAGVFAAADKVIKSETDDIVFLALTKAEDIAKDGDAQIVKINDDVALMVSDLKKSFQGYDFDSTSFKEIMSKGAFVPSICVAQDMLARTIYNVLEKADAPKEAAVGIQTAVKEFADYVTMLAKGLPTSAFKADLEFSKGDYAKKKKPAEEEKKDKDVKKNAAEGDAGTKTEKTDQVAKAGFEDGKGTGTDPKATADDANSVADGKKKPNPDVADLFKELSDSLTKSLGNGIAGLKDQVEQSIATVKTEVGKVSSRVDQLGETVKKNDVALNGTVATREEHDNTGLRKGDGDGQSGAPALLDTAFMKLEEPKRGARRN